METKGKTLVTKRKTLLGDQREDLFDSAKHNQLPAGPREKRPIGRLFSSIKYLKKSPSASAWDACQQNLHLCAVWSAMILCGQVSQC